MCIKKVNLFGEKSALSFVYSLGEKLYILSCLLPLSILIKLGFKPYLQFFSHFAIKCTYIFVKKLATNLNYDCELHFQLMT